MKNMPVIVAYCENCPIKAKIKLSPDGNIFWKFLKEMVDTGICSSCR